MGDAQKVLLFLPNGFEALEASAFTDVFGWNQVVGDKRTPLVTVGIRPRLQCTWNFIVQPEAQLEALSLDEFAALAMPGGFQRAGFYEDAYDERTLEMIRNFAIQEKWIASVCVGALPIAKSGVLNGKKATTYHLEGGRWQEKLGEMGPNVERDLRIVEDGKIITSSCPSTAVEVAFMLLARLTSEENARRVRREMGYSESAVF
ncbi:DJ-1/PfpI family protein [Acidaminobacter hydrogenoformans]|uniref:4-methyl-5(B-hydroxyethyl)-thiazole monophosphate biosynthesis n=1 Tax=Acidaminobacter hydrogenoformans DSM 2784 TaxID=1120920 RepID=A0A1G5S8R1_9FIRM|nr:DJ-1/PfpI family protein [Acidaminobacter hydrogenoformans]SCZ82101.1 4-methyl-5(b-hydroxyethyl)-thiazole monophosphate biosynthesis [Acidaminobacter hydrogenoformans DSM 2784]